MYNLVVVDDERIILDSLYETLQEALGDEMNIDRCLGSTQALERIQTRVDILLTDIFMPKMDGIELARRTRDAWPDCQVIFITGDETLDSAQKAIRSGLISDYILKLEDSSILLGAVRNAASSLDQLYIHQLEQQQFQARYKAILPVLRKDLLLDVLSGEASGQELCTESQALGLTFDWAQPMTLLSAQIEPLHPDKHFSHVEMNRIFLFVDQLLSGFASGSHTIFGMTEDHIRLLWFVQQIPGQSSDSRISASLDIVQTNCMKLFGCSVTFVLNRTPIACEALPRLYEQICLVQTRYRHLNDSLFYVEDVTLADLFSPRQENTTQQQLLTQLEDALLSGSLDQATLLIDGVCVHGLSAEIYYGICSAFMKAMSTIQMDKTSHNEICALLLGPRNLSEQKKSLLQAAEMIIKVTHRQNRDVVRSVEWVVQYINGHLSSDLSLTTVSAMVYHSPTYFSKLFKRTMGIGYCEYVTRQRLSWAATLLTETDEKIYQIVKDVGFESTPYFIRIFKKEYGCTPQTFRNTASAGQKE